MIPYRKDLLNTARTLRKNMTSEERHLWYDFLKSLPIPIKRQFRIKDYIVDFYIPSYKLVIEVDGRQHSFEKNKAYDQERDKALNALEIKVLRIKNKDINEKFGLVKKKILAALDITFDQIIK